MRAVVQRVSEASVSIEGNVKGSIGRGFMVLLGVLTSAPDETAARQKTGGLLLAALLLTAAGTLAGNALLHYLFI